jgi:hypothetical protein
VKTPDQPGRDVGGPVSPVQQHATDRALNLVAKWRTIFVGWQLGTRTKADPEAQAVRDHRELSILLRVELSAFAGLLMEKGVFTREEWMGALEREALLLEEIYQQRFPGVRATDDGLVVDFKKTTWMKGWRP